MDKLLFDFEMACRGLNDPQRHAECEKALLELRKTEQAIPVAQYILQNERDPLVQFQAGLMLRQASVDQWSTLSIEGKAAIRAKTIGFVVDKVRQGFIERPVMMQVLQALAIMWKCSWLDKDETTMKEKKELFELVGTMLLEPPRKGAENSGLSVRILGCRFLSALVDEFSAGKASAIGLSFEFHRKCKYSFEKAGLRETFLLARRMLDSIYHGTIVLLSGGARVSLHSFQQGQRYSEQPSLDRETTEALRSALGLIEACMAWDFETDSDGAHILQVESIIDRREHVTLQMDGRITPGRAWREVLVDSNLIQVLFQLYFSLRPISIGMASSGGESSAHLIRQILVQLTLLNGDIFTDDVDRARYASILVIGTVEVLKNPLIPLLSAATGIVQTFEQDTVHSLGGAEFLDLCTILSRIVSNFNADIMLMVQSTTLPNQGPGKGFDDFLGHVCGLGQALLEGAAMSAQRVGDAADQSWMMEGLDHVLELLSHFASWVETKLRNADSLTELQRMGVQFICTRGGALFRCYVENRLGMARAVMLSTSTARMEANGEKDEDDEDFEDASVLDGHLTAVASLARLVPQDALVLLTGLLSNATNVKKALHPTTPMADVSKVNEELFWLVLILGYIIADPGNGEDPMIPTNLLRLKQIGSKPFEPIIAASDVLFSLLHNETQSISANPYDERVSPLLNEKLVATLKKWAHTYLMPDSSLYEGETLTKIFGQDLAQVIKMSFSQVSVLDFLVQKMTIYLSKWGFQSAASEAALGVLEVVVSNPRCSVELNRLSSWNALISANLAAVSPEQNVSWHPLDEMRPEEHGKLVKVMIKSLDTRRDTPPNQVQESRKAFMAIVSPISLRLEKLEVQALSLAKSRSSAICTPVWSRTMLRVIELYGGVVQASASGNLGSWVRDACLPAMCGPFVKIGMTLVPEAYDKSFASGEAKMVISSILDWFTKYLEDQLEVTPNKQVGAVFQACGEMLSIYVQCNRLREADRAAKSPSATKAGTLWAEEAEDWAQDVLNLLKMLTALSDRDMLDFSEDLKEAMSSPIGNTDAAQLVLQGLSIIVPLITKDLLQFQGIARQYFMLLTSLVQVYPEKLSNLDPVLFDAVTNSLQYGMNDYRVDVARVSFEALSSLAQFHASDTRKTPPGPGLSFQLRGERASTMLDFLRFVFSFLVFQNFDSSLLDPAANAMLSLIACEQQNFAPMVNEIIQSEPNEKNRQRLADAFSRLAYSNGVNLTFDRLNRRKFKKNVLAFVNDVRGFMRKR